MGLSVGSYNATLTINEFKGVMQFDANESMNTDMRYAADAQNIDTRDGNLLPIGEPVRLHRVSSTYVCSVVSATVFKMSSFIQILGTTTIKLGPNIIVAIAEISRQSTNKYRLVIGDEANGLFVYDTNIDLSASPSIIKGSTFSFVQYVYTPQGFDTQVDVLLFSGPFDGMYMLRADNLQLTAVTTPAKFNRLGRHGERIWGTAGSTLYYSAPYDPTDWSANVSIPANGGGSIEVPTFDGEKFTALKSFGGNLLAFKESHIIRISGLTIDELYVQEQFGMGTVFPNTIVEYEEKLYFLTDKGVCIYDGVGVHPFQQYALRTFWRDKMQHHVGRNTAPVGVIWNNKYIIAFCDPLTIAADVATVTYGYNKYNVIYDFSNGSWRYYDTLYPTNVLLPLNNATNSGVSDGLFFIPSNTQYTPQVLELDKWYPSIEEVPVYETNGIPTSFRGFTWTTPWTDMGCKDVLKSQFEVRFWIQTHVNTTATSPMTDTEKLKLEITIETERGSKTREMLFDRDVDKEIKMRYHITGRKARMTIKVRNGTGGETMHAWCKIMGGMQINADTASE